MGSMRANKSAPRTLILEKHADWDIRRTRIQREITQDFQDPEPLEDMIDVNLLHCYFAIFDGLPLDELFGWRGFMDAHERHEPPINTLYDFEAHTEAVLAMFLDNDFAEEYEDNRTIDPETFPAVDPRLTSAGIADALRAMKATITLLGGEAVTAEIERLFEEYGERPPTRDPHAFDRMLRHYLCPPPVQLHPQTPPPTGNAAVYRLLARLQGLA